MGSKWLSRKFLAVVGGGMVIIGGMLEGTIDYSSGINSLIILILSYMGVEGVLDLKSR